MQLSARIKDWLRENQIPQIVTLLAQVLDNNSIFEKKTVKGTLKVLATLIDWNELNLFDSCRAKISEFQRVKQLRAGAFQCLGSLVGKGMLEMEKLTIIKQSGYLEEVRDAAYNLLNDYQTNFGTDEYDEEKSYMIAISNSVSHVGKWCLSLQTPQESKADPFPDPESR